MRRWVVQRVAVVAGWPNNVRNVSGSSDAAANRPCADCRVTPIAPPIAVHVSPARRANTTAMSSRVSSLCRSSVIWTSRSSASRSGLGVLASLGPGSVGSPAGSAASAEGRSCAALCRERLPMPSGCPDKGVHVNDRTGFQFRCRPRAGAGSNHSGGICPIEQASRGEGRNRSGLVDALTAPRGGLILGSALVWAFEVTHAGARGGGRADPPRGLVTLV